jgi:adenylylsulfate kinase-like enzyme
MSLELCKPRGPKGLCSNARADLIPNFTGIGSPYTSAEAPEITLMTAPSDLQTAWIT